MKIRVLSYNIHRAIGFDRRFAPERIIKIIREQNPDIVLLQEVDEGAPRSRELNLARELAEALGYAHYAMGHNVTLRKGRYGNATLSRFPILRERNIDLTLANRKRRGCQHTTIALTDKEGNQNPLEVFNLHLGLSAKERYQQVETLTHSDEFARLEPDMPCLIGGDFNDWRSLLRGFYTEDFDFKCATDILKPSGQPKALKTYPSFAPRGGLDRLYYRGDMQLLAVDRCKNKTAKIASDHLPIIADFDIYPEKSLPIQRDKHQSQVL